MHFATEIFTIILDGLRLDLPTTISKQLLIQITNAAILTNNPTKVAFGAEQGQKRPIIWIPDDISQLSNIFENPFTISRLFRQNGNIFYGWLISARFEDRIHKNRKQS